RSASRASSAISRTPSDGSYPMAKPVLSIGSLLAIFAVERAGARATLAHGVACRLPRDCGCRRGGEGGGSPLGPHSFDGRPPAQRAGHGILVGGFARPQK